MSAVQRSVFMDDYVHSIAEDVVRVQSLRALGSDVAAVPLTLTGCKVGNLDHEEGERVLQGGCACLCTGCSVDCSAPAGCS